jgi:hypothetical protein
LRSCTSTDRVNRGRVSGTQACAWHSPVERGWRGSSALARTLSVTQMRSLRADRRPTSGRERAVAALGYRGLQGSLLISFAVIFGLGFPGSHSGWLAVAQIVAGVTLLFEGSLLATNWLGARRLTVWRIQRRGGGGDASGSPAARVLLDLVTQLAGVFWLAGGLYLLWIGAAAGFK